MPSPLGVTISVSTTVLSGAVSVNVIVPVSLYPPDKPAESSGIALPTTVVLPAKNEAVVIKLGLAGATTSASC